MVVFILFVCLVWKRCEERENKKPKRGEEAQMNE
jgi:hypothetical protein